MTDDEDRPVSEDGPMTRLSVNLRADVAMSLHTVAATEGVSYTDATNAAIALYAMVVQTRPGKVLVGYTLDGEELVLERHNPAKVNVEPVFRDLSRSERVERIVKCYLLSRHERATDVKNRCHRCGQWLG